MKIAASILNASDKRESIIKLNDGQLAASIAIVPRQEESSEDEDTDATGFEFDESFEFLDDKEDNDEEI